MSLAFIKGTTAYYIGDSRSVIGHRTITTDGGGGSGTLTDATQIIVNRSTGYSPMGVVFKTDLSDDHMADHHIFWTFDDAGTYGLLDSARLAGRDKNTAYGPTAAHTFYTGSYDVTCYIHSNLDFQTLTKTITVTSADTTFPTTNTIAVATDADFTGKPTGAQESSTVADAISKLEANGSGRIVFKGGQTFSVPAEIERIKGRDLSGATTATNVAFSNYSGFGTSVKPIIDNDANSGQLELDEVQNSSSQYSISGLEFKSDYDPTDGTGSSISNGNKMDGLGIGNDTNLGDFTIDDCYFHNCSQNISQLSNSAAGVYLVITNTESTAWEDYGAWVRSANISIVGCKFHQHVDAVNSNDTKILTSSPNFPDHGPLRIAEGGVCAINKNDFFSRNGWSSDGKGWQPCIRTETEANTDGRAYYSITENQCEGGGAGIITNNGQTTSERNAYAGCWVADKNHIVGGTATYQINTSGGFFHIGKGNSTIKNNICIVPNVLPLPAWNDMKDFVNVNPGSVHTATNRAQRIRVHGNTFVDLRTTANQSTDSLIYNSSEVTSVGWTDFTEEGNIYHAPNRTSPTVVSNLSTTDVFTPANKGHKYEPLTSFTSPTPAGVGNTASYDASTGSGAIGGATLAQAPVDDFYGTIRKTVVDGLTRTTYCDGHKEVNEES